MSIKLKGSTDGSVTLQAPADTSPTGTDKTLTLPTTEGSANQFVKNGSTAGTLEYSSMVEDSSGNVGIGTTSPSAPLGFGKSVFGEPTSEDFYRIKFDDNGGINNDVGIGMPDASSLGFNSVSDGSIRFYNGTDGESMRIDSSGRVLIGRTESYTTDTSVNLQIRDSSGPRISLSTGQVGNNSLLGAIDFGADEGQGREAARISAYSEADFNTNDHAAGIRFETTPDNSGTRVERMRIGANGFIGLHNATSTGGTNNGNKAYINYDNGHLYIACNQNASAYFNRNINDGQIVQFRQANVVEGNVSVSGSTVSYNGGHLSRWSQLANNAERTEILRGSVLSNLDEMCEWAYEAQDAVFYTEEDELPEGVSVGDVKTPAVAAGTEDNEQLNRMKVSDVEGDRNVAGVFQAWDDDDDTYTNDFYCAMTGDFIIRIAQGTTVARGDLLMSAGDGTAKPQDDDIVRSKTIAKVTSTTVSETYSDGSYCVPCVLMAC